MKLFDFGRRAPTVTKTPVASSAPPAPRREPIDEIINADWSFAPMHDRVFAHEDIRSAAAIYQAQQTQRIAAEVELIRKHLTRLKLVQEPDV